MSRRWPLIRALRVLCASAVISFSIPAFAADGLFDDPILAKAKNFQIRESEMEEAFLSHKAAAAALNQRPPPASEPQLKRQILEKMIVTKLLVTRATPEDRDEGRKTADRMIAENKERAGSEATYRRRLLAVGSSAEKYEAEMLEQAIVQAVIDRELKNREIISEADVKKFYDENPDLYRIPEKARAAHILFAARKIPTGEPLSLEQRLAKKAAADAALARAKAGEDFTKLVRELTEDPESKDKDGEITFARDSGFVPPQFEGAAFSLQPGQLSDVVQTVFGYHVIKLLEKIPASAITIEKAEARIRDALQRQGVQKKLPDYLEQLKKESAVELVER